MYSACYCPAVFQMSPAVWYTSDRAILDMEIKFLIFKMGA